MARWSAGEPALMLPIPAGLSGVTAIAAGGYHSLALKSDGTVVGWGATATGQTTIPAGLSGVIAIAAGYHHSLALKSDGTVVGWGDNTMMVISRFPRRAERGHRRSLRANYASQGLLWRFKAKAPLKADQTGRSLRAHAFKLLTSMKDSVVSRWLESC